MSAYSTGIDYSLLFAISTSTTDPLLNAIYNGGTATSSPAQALVNYNLAVANSATDIAQEEDTPAVQRDIAAFTSAVTSATSVEQLLSNPTVLKVLLTANGLSDEDSYTALAQKTLMSNLKDPDSLVNQLDNTDWTNLVSSYDFYDNGLSTIQNGATITSITNAYAETLWRNSLDTTTPGLSNALAFRDEASSITSVDQILGDSAMRDVVTTVLGLPEQIAEQPLSQQEDDISSRVDLSNFQNSGYVDTMVQQYLILKATSASSSTSSSAISTITSLVA